MPFPEELVFTVDAKVRSDINRAKHHYRNTVSKEQTLGVGSRSEGYFHLLIFCLISQAQNLQLVCYAFTAFGKEAIKQRKLHPDTFVQLAMQLAYYRKHGRY